MKSLYSRNLVALALAGILLAPASVLAGPKTEDELIAELDNPNAERVASTMLAIEKQYPNSTKSFPKLKAFLKDSRPKVRRKAARVLGSLHADVDKENLKDIVALTKSADPDEAIDGLKALRGLKAADTIPDIKACLNSPTPNVIRDACRTIAALGSKSDIPAIEPLLNHKSAAVQKDAQDAIFALKSKS
jgi:HEAT repeat protein